MMSKLKLILSFILLFPQCLGASDLWRDLAQANLRGKLGIGLAIITGYEIFLPADLPEKKKPVVEGSSPVSVSGLFEPRVCPGS